MHESTTEHCPLSFSSSLISIMTETALLQSRDTVSCSALVSLVSLTGDIVLHIGSEVVLHIGSEVVLPVRLSYL